MTTPYNDIEELDRLLQSATAGMEAAAKRFLLRHLDGLRRGGTGQRALLHRDQAKRGGGHQRGGGAEDVTERVTHVVGGNDDGARGVMLAGERNVGTECDQQDRRERRNRE